MLTVLLYSHLLTLVSTGESSVKGMCPIVNTALQETCRATERQGLFLISFIPCCHPYFTSAMVVAKQISPSTKHIHTVENTLKVLHKEDVKSSPEKSNQRECNISFQIGKMLLQEVTEELDKE